jgi:hypothetical protein
MSRQGYENKEVVSAINAVTTYRNILLKMLKDEKDFANQHSLMFMMELNNRLINFLNIYKENNNNLKKLPTYLQVSKTDLGRYQTELYNNIVENNLELKRFAKSQNIRWDNLLSALAAIPGDMLEPFAIVMLLGTLDVGGSTAIQLLLDVLLMPEWIAFDLAAGGYLAIFVVAAAVVVALAVALSKMYDKLKPTYANDGYTGLSSDELSALNELVDLTQNSFETTLEHVGSADSKFEKLSITRAANDTMQRFFKPQPSSTSSLAEEAAAKYVTVSSVMSI